jgi:hypothetical protein
MSEAATSAGDREIEESSAVTAASTEDAWTQLIGRADIDKAVAAAQPTSGDAGLPWSYEDTWPLSERQLRHLSFELLLLCPPGELEAEDDPQDEAPQGEASASASELPTLSSLSEAQRVVLAEGLSAQLAKCVRGAEQPDGELPSLVRLAAGLEDCAEEEAAGAAAGEEALEARLAELSPISPPYLPHISPISRPYLAYLSPISRPGLPRGAAGAAAGGGGASG